MATRSLSEEVVTEILSWLPAKDLIRSRCVCKAWFRLLTTDPYFHNLHLHRLINNHPKHTPSIMHLQLQNFFLTSTDSDESPIPTVKIPCPFNISSPTQHHIFGICNGLVCMANPALPNISVWNPLTDDHVIIPSPYPSGTTSITYGFGFCRVTSEFKVFRILYFNYSELQSDVSVYTLGTNSWRTLGTVPYFIHILRPHTALVNNFLHWFGETPGSFDNLVVSFDMKQEIFQEVPRPNGIDYNYSSHFIIGELGGLLCIFCRTAKQCIEIWVMKEYGNVDSWMKQFIIGPPEVSRDFFGSRPLGLADGEEIIIVNNAREIVLYNPKTNSTRRLKKFDCELNNAYPFIGSIVSPRLVNGVNTSAI